jgi:FAD/FMN-containing dehydrogenase
MNYRSAGWDPGFTPQDVTALSSITEGPVLVAGDPDLADEVSFPEITIVHEPDIAIAASNPADVQAAVRFSADFHLPLAVVSPGHLPPRSAKGGVLITTRRMNQIHLDRRSRTAIVGAGALWSDVVDRPAELGDPRSFGRLCDSDPSDVDLGVITAMTFVLFR